MTSIDYPDLTASAAQTLDDVLPQAHTDMAEPLAASRRSPLPASPQALGSEPADYTHLLATSPVPTAQFAVWGHTPHLHRPTHEWGVNDLLVAYRQGTTTPSEVLATLRARWADHGLTGGAILAVLDTVAEAAAESDRRWRAGAARPLEGIFFGVKDIIDVAGAPVTAGSRTTGDRVASTDATAVARLRAAGAIPALITATTEFACGAPHNARYGAVTNPWDRDRWTGGSSTGSAAALAAGLVPFALGTDTGGSIRVPSALCNLTGIKPTYGLVPRTGVASLSWTLDHIGPMARNAADLRTVLAVLAGADGLDPAAAPDAVAQDIREGLRTPESPTAHSFRGLRLGVPTTWFTDLCDDGVRAVWEDTLAELRRHGVETTPVDLGDAALIHDELAVVMTTELASNQEAAERFDLFDIGTQVRIARGNVPSAVDYLRALRHRPGALRRVIQAFDAAGVDAILTPGVGATAPRLSDVTLDVNGTRHPMQALIGRNTGVFDYLGLPAVMMPGGFHAGMPVGVQVVGRPWGDDAVLRIANAYQSLTDHHDRRADG
ncbi:amidase [Gordonia rhizosphera]|uniref:Aspartyl/glutamyl-tRNA(Asn/Gln) amidotransferase subunit A n=1 Tax=Gordonia rhizosphera NBRC 16068 TaxID=1108045 RepID=K6V4W5_9ACTN|nr:amidase [Gordonia rhizosphera]GAB91228.1 aspartyl/glutamyl-tRNA(Asn/Gln) amidotransferase subunit A [Gordonia rhizosphera NBRC 16068]